MTKFYDLIFSRQPDGSIRLIQSNCGEDCIIDLHPAQLRHVAESSALVAPTYPADELSKRLAEGIETALAAAELFGLPVWSCISTSGLESFEPPDGVREVVVFADHDLNFAGQKAAYAAAYRLTQRGIGVDVKVPDFLGDWSSRNSALYCLKL